MLSSSLLHFPLWSIIPFILVCIVLGITLWQVDVVHQSAIVTLSVFLTVVCLWVCSKIDETYIAVLAVFVLVMNGNLAEAEFYISWGQDILLIDAVKICA